MKAYKVETVDQLFKNGLFKHEQRYDETYFFNRDDAYAEARNRLMLQLKLLKICIYTQYEINKIKYRPSRYCKIVYKDVKSPEFKDEKYETTYMVSEIDIVE